MRLERRGIGEDRGTSTFSYTAALESHRLSIDLI